MEVNGFVKIFSAYADTIKFHKITYLPSACCSHFVMDCEKSLGAEFTHFMKKIVLLKEIFQV